MVFGHCPDTHGNRRDHDLRRKPKSYSQYTASSQPLGLALALHKRSSRIEVLFWEGSYSKDYHVLRSISGSRHFVKLPRVPTVNPKAYSIFMSQVAQDLMQPWTIWPQKSRVTPKNSTLLESSEALSPPDTPQLPLPQTA